MPTSGDVVRDALISGLEKYVVDAVGYDETNDIGGKMYFNRLVDDLLLFESNDWQKYDATVAAGLTLLATKKHVYKPPPVPDDFILIKKHRVNKNFYR